MTTLYAYATSDGHLIGQATVTGEAVTGNPMITQALAKFQRDGRSAEAAVAALDGYSNGYVRYTTQATGLTEQLGR